jgi:carboxypeptidase T
MLMRNLLIIILLSTFLLDLNAQQERYSRVKVNLHNKNIEDIARLGLEADHGYFVPNYFLINEFSESELLRLNQAGFTYQTLVEDVYQEYLKQNAPKNDLILRGPLAACESKRYAYKTPRNYREGSMGGYFTYTEMLSILDSMRLLYPNLISAKKTISDTLKSIENRPLHWIKISDNPSVDENEPEVLYTALHHAREPQSLAQTLYFMWYLLENYATDPEIKYIVDNSELYFVPCVNPDGYVFNESTNPSGGGFWRKNKRLNSNGSVGVDLNRNYGFNWGFNDVGSSNQPSFDTYRGTSAFSEPENRLMRLFCSQHQFQMSLNYHAFGNLLVYPWGYSNKLTPDSTIFIGFGKAFNRENGFYAGTGLQTVGYNVNGDADDWMYGDTITKKKMYSFTPEIGPQYYGFWPPKNVIVDLNKTAILQNLTAPLLLQNYGLARDRAPQYLTTKTGKIAFDLQRLGLQNGTLTVTLKSGNANVISVGTSKSYTLKQFQTISDSIDYSLRSTLKGGEEILILLNVSNGLYTHTDTLRKVFGSPLRLLYDPCDNLNNWTIQGTWNVSSEDYTSDYSCITDSPTSLYGNNVKTNLTSKKAIILPNAVPKILLKFSTKWDIEYINDYVTPYISTNGTTFTPICGKLTRSSNKIANLNDPVYEGLKREWQQEEFDLTAYAGLSIWWRFSFNSDVGTQANGFLFDDFEVLASTIDRTGIDFLNENEFTLSPNSPNPFLAFTEFSIDINTSKNTPTHLIVTDILGKEILRQIVDSQQIRLNTEGWQNGVYFYQVERNGLRSKAKKMVKI